MLLVTSSGIKSSPSSILNPHRIITAKMERISHPSLNSSTNTLIGTTPDFTKGLSLLTSNRTITITDMGVRNTKDEIAQ
jgi:hypothetical protein